MVASEVEKSDLRVFVLIDVGVRSLVVGYVVKRHAGSLLPESDSLRTQGSCRRERSTLPRCRHDPPGAASQGRGIDGHGQDTLQGAQAVCGYEERLYDVRPQTIAGGDRNLVLVTDQHRGIRPKPGRSRVIDHIHGQRLVARVAESELQVRGMQDRDIAVQLDGLTRCRDVTATGVDKINLLLSVQARRFGGSVRRQRGVGIGIDVAEDRALVGGILGIAAGEDVPLDQRTGWCVRSRRASRRSRGRDDRRLFAPLPARRTTRLPVMRESFSPSEHAP